MQEGIVHEHVDVPAYRTSLIANTAVQRRVALLELFQCGTHGRRRKTKFGGATAIMTKHRWNVNGYRHVGLRVMERSLHSFLNRFHAKRRREELDRIRTGLAHKVRNQALTAEGKWNLLL